MPQITRSMLRNIKFDDFDPNDIQDESPVWAVYDESRFRTYGNRGAALNAFMASYKAKLYQMVDSRWVERAVKPISRLSFEHRACDICGQRPVEAIFAYKRQQGRVPTGETRYAHGYWVWEKVKGKIPNPPKLLFICYQCKINTGL